MKTIISAAAAAVLVLPGINAEAQAKATEKSVDLAIEQQSLADALNEWAQQTGLQLVSPGSQMMNVTLAPRIQGEYTAQAALEELLKGTSLSYEWVSERAVAIREEPRIVPAALQMGGTERWVAANDQSAGGGVERLQKNRAGPDGNDVENPEGLVWEVLVTGTHIKGRAPAGSPVIVLDEQTIRRSGYTSTEQLIQSLPQNVRSGMAGESADSRFSSGSAAGLNVGRGSGANLRGLGSNATLTLINGRRIAASSQGTLTDISLIPIDAIERIEVLADGASAIYGADAVGGVLNVILKSEYSGPESRIKYGATSPHGRDELRASQSLGGHWSGGSALAVLDYMDQSELTASERDFTAQVAGPTSIFPESRQLGVVVAGSQELGRHLALEFDAQYGQVERHASDATTGSGIFDLPIHIDRTNAGLRIADRFSDNWELSLDGQVSEEDTEYSRLLFTPGSTVPDPSSERVDIAQRQWGVGLKASGKLYDLPAGALRVAVGVDHRSEEYDGTQSSPFASRQDANRDVDSAYAEFSVPLFSENNARPGFERMDLSVAARYDDYSDFGHTANPKVGLTWSPVAGLELRSTYGTSFRAPAAGNELYTSANGTDRFVSIISFATADGTGTLPVAYVTGSRQLEPEEAETWTAGFTLRPEVASGLRLDFTYYDVRYTNRIVLAPFDLGALANPALQSFFTAYGSPTALQAAITEQVGAPAEYFDVTGPDFSGGEFGPNPQNVTTYLFDGRYLNAGTVKTSGFDFIVDYSMDLMSGVGTLGFNANRINKIETILAPGAPAIDSVGTTSNPAGLRLRGSAAYSRAGWDAALAINFTDGYKETSGLVDGDVDSYVTVDASLRYTIQSPSSTILENLSVSLSALNLLGEKPPFVPASLASRGATYDPANADPLGRFVAIEVAKRW